MAQPVAAGSYTNLFNQKLVQSILALAGSAPGAQAAVNSPLLAQMDASLVSNVQNVDVMLSTVGLDMNAGSGAASSAAPAAAGGFINALGSTPQGAQSQPGIQRGQVGNTGLSGPLANNLSLNA